MAHALFRFIAVVHISLVLASGLQPSAKAASKALVVIVSTSLPLKDISTALVRRAFLGEGAEYASGKRLIPLNHPIGTPTRAQFDAAVLGLEGAAVGRFWIDRRIRDQSSSPRTVPVDLALRLVMSVPGMITYVTADVVNDKVRVLTIDGKAPNQAGYLLSE